MFTLLKAHLILVYSLALSVVLGLFIVLNQLDVSLYQKIVDKYGPQYKTWLGSGFYLWLKYWWRNHHNSK